jgi:hypothetical protein
MGRFGARRSHARPRIDIRRWLVSKLAPEKCGDKLNHESTGRDGEPMRHKVEIYPRVA